MPSLEARQLMSEAGGVWVGDRARISPSFVQHPSCLLSARSRGAQGHVPNHVFPYSIPSQNSRGVLFCCLVQYCTVVLSGNRMGGKRQNIQYFDMFRAFNKHNIYKKTQNKTRTLEGLFAKQKYIEIQFRERSVHYQLKRTYVIGTQILFHTTRW